MALLLQGEKPIPAERLARIEELIEPWFIFALVWSIGMTGDHDSQLKFSKWIKEKMKAEGVGLE
jgi:dynein heavy chain